jgi:hypothetical protein
VSNKRVVHALIAAIDAGDEDALRGLLDEALVSHGALGDVHGPDGSSGSCSATCGRGSPTRTWSSWRSSRRATWQGPDVLAMLLDMGLFPPGAERS